MRLFKTLLLFLPLFTFALSVEGVPKQYAELFRNLPLSGKLAVKNFNGSFRAVLVQNTSGGTRYVEIVSGSLLDFYRKLYTLAGKEVKTVSLTVYYRGRKLPFNPFYQIWDTTGTVKILSFANLRPACVQPVLRLEAKSVRGAKIIVPFEEVKKLFFEGGFKYPAYYCY